MAEADDRLIAKVIGMCVAVLAAIAVFVTQSDAIAFGAVDDPLRAAVGAGALFVVGVIWLASGDAFEH